VLVGPGFAGQGNCNLSFLGKDGPNRVPTPVSCIAIRYLVSLGYCSRTLNPLSIPPETSIQYCSAEKSGLGSKWEKNAQNCRGPVFAQT